MPIPPFLRPGVAATALAGLLLARAAGAETGGPESASRRSGAAASPYRGAAARVTMSGTAGGPQRRSTATLGRRPGAVLGAAALPAGLAERPFASVDAPTPNRRRLADASAGNLPRQPELFQAPAPPPVPVSPWPEPNNYLLGLAGLGLVL